MPELSATCPRTGLTPGTPAIVHIRHGNSESWPLVERVHGGWQSGAHHYPDADVVGVRAYIPPAREITDPVDRELEAEQAAAGKALDKIARYARPDEDGTWTDADGLLEAIGNAVESTGRKVWDQEATDDE